MKVSLQPGVKQIISRYHKGRRTNTIPKEHKSNKVKVLSIANLFANSIDAVLKNESISKNFLR